MAGALPLEMKTDGVSISVECEPVITPSGPLNRLRRDVELNTFAPVLITRSFSPGGQIRIMSLLMASERRSRLRSISAMV